MPPFWTIFVSALFSGDVALIASLYFFTEGQLAAGETILAFVLAISIADLPFFVLGRLAHKIKMPWVQTLAKKGKAWLGKLVAKEKVSSLDQFMFMTRFIPASRLISYVALGFLGYSPLRFLVLLLLGALVYILICVGLIALFPLDPEESKYWSFAIALSSYAFFWLMFKAVTYLKKRAQP